MSPSIQITKVREDPGETSLKVEIPTELVKAAETRAASRYAKKARLPGFRKGKVPLQVIKKKFHEGIREAALQDLIGNSWKAALEQEDLKPLADPRVKDLKFEAESPVTFELLVEVKPKLELNRVAGFKVTRKVAKITDTMVAEQLESLRQRAGECLCQQRLADPCRTDEHDVGFLELNVVVSRRVRVHPLVVGVDGNR